VEIRSRVPGYLEEIAFTDGQLVTEGQVLFKIDARPYVAALDQAKSEVAKWEAQVTKFQADLVRLKKLREDNSITQGDLDVGVASELTASASLLGAKAAVEQAQVNLNYATITSPITGRASATNVTKGNLVASGDMGGPALTRIATVHPVYVYFNMDERAVLKIRERMLAEGTVIAPETVKSRGLKVHVQPDNPQLKPITGVLDFVDIQVDATTGTMRGRAIVDNEQALLAEGMFVRVRMELPKTQQRVGVLIPERAVGTSLGEKFVYVVNDKNVALQRRVLLGRRRGESREVLPNEQGEPTLTPADRIIVAGLLRVRDGVTVQPMEEQPAAKP
jgi:RND family efflux transporter MFP subunit